MGVDVMGFRSAAKDEAEHEAKMREYLATRTPRPTVEVAVTDPEVDLHWERYTPRPPRVRDVTGSFGDLSLRHGVIRRGHLHRWPAAGAHADVESGAQRTRMTGTRVLVGTAIVPGVGTIVGALSRKDRTRVYLTITLASGEVLMEDAKSKDEGAARKFANAVNSASARASS